MRPRDEYAEPYRIRMVEPIRLPDRGERERAIREAGFNLFNLKSRDVYIDLLTDSGTGSMSNAQWSAMMMGDEAYAGSRSYDRLRDVVASITGYPYLVVAHQGRGAEHLLMRSLVSPGDRIPGNMHFDTTQGHILLADAEPVNLVSREGKRIQSDHPFKGNVDLAALEAELSAHRDRIPFILLTVTCNNNGGQPVSMANARAVSRLAADYDVPLFFDAARFAENAHFVREREAGYGDRSPADIAREMFGLGSGCTMSAKKDGLANIGGFLATSDEALYRRAGEWQIPFEGFSTYGGLAGRDLEAVATGLEEVVDPQYLEDRVGAVAYLASLLVAEGIPVVMPPGGHGVFIDAAGFLPHVPRDEFPGQVLAVELYRAGGVRGVELGTAAFARRDPHTGETLYPDMELLRLAIPRRTYTDRHLAHVARAVAEVWGRRDSLRGLEMTYEAPVLRHFTARFEPLP